MGTRHLIAVVLDGEYKVAQYGQWDGYLDGQGANICDFILNRMDLNKFKSAVRECEFVSNEELKKMWVDCGANPESELVSVEVSDTFGDKYPQLSRNAGAEVLAMIQDRNARQLLNSISFAKDSLFCEFGYVIDLDNEVLEVFKGFNENPLDESERFYTEEEMDGKYYPIKFVESYKFSEIDSNTMRNLGIKMNTKGLYFDYLG